MWSYYGAKTKVIRYYPKPKYQKIIEPFAGTARYALRYFENDVLLVDQYHVIIDIWTWLQQCSEKDITSLPDLKIGQKTTDFNLTETERNFLGFLIQGGTATPGIIVSKWNMDNGSPSVEAQLKRISESLFKIRHWEIKLGSYTDIQNEAATWFIDPPYQHGGHKYKFSNRKLDYDHLSIWCNSREGQAIVCENSKATWMNFKPAFQHRGSLDKNQHEVIWTNHKLSPMGHQQILL